jgi:hypothetical protein
VYDSSGTELASTNSVSDGTYSGGTFGFYCGSDVPGYFDYVTEGPIDDSHWENSDNFVVVDSFERESLEHYSFAQGESGASITSDGVGDYTSTNIYGPSYSGKHSLKISDTNTKMASTSGLNNYPVAGDTFACWVMGVDGAAKANVKYGVQSDTEMYYVHFNFRDDELDLVKYADGTSVILDNVTSGINLSEDTWYWVEVHWKTDGTHEVELYDVKDSTLAYLEGSDSTWSSGGIGYSGFAGDSGGTVYFDDFIIGTKDSDKGGWGPEFIYSMYRADGDSEEVDLVYDFESSLTYGGVTESPEGDSWLHTFTVAHFNHTYYQDETFSPNPQPSALSEAKRNELNRNIISVSGADDSGHDYIFRSDRTYAMFATGSDWRTWVDNNWGARSSRKEVREKSIEAMKEAIQESRSAYYSSLSALFALIAILEPTPLGEIVYGADLISATLSVGSLIQSFTDIPCDNNGSDSNTSSTRTWDYCGAYPLTAFVTEFYIEVPEGDEVTVTIENKATPSKNMPVNQTHIYEYSVPGNGSNAHLVNKSP